MSAIVLALILVSSFLHALWNFRGKSESPSPATFALTATFTGLQLSPFLLFLTPVIHAFDVQVTVLLMASCCCQAIYFVGLGAGYAKGDMSLMYPLSRAFPVLIVPPVVWLTHTGAEIGLMAGFGMLLVVVGCLLLPLKHLDRRSLCQYQQPVMFMAVVTALGTVGYSVLDNIAINRMSEYLPGTANAFKIAATYLILQMIGTPLLLMAGTLMSRQQRKALKTVAVNHSRTLALTGLCMGVTYGMVLASMAFVENVSYVMALRQLSIPIGVFMGVFWLHESASLPKRWGVALMLIGLVMVSL